jgi:argininosuccinate lyase
MLPGYTHTQLAMPSSFGLWFGAWAESLSDDMELLIAAYNMVNRNPLGSGAGYGSSFPLNRELTTGLLHFGGMNVNVVYAQMTRGKTERVVATAIAGVAATLSRLSADVCLFCNQNMAFVSFPPAFTTGSSIMPHKKNPDVFELVRGHCNGIQALPNQLTLLTTNLISGYHRDVQLTKEYLFPALQQMKQCIEMVTVAMAGISVVPNILQRAGYDMLYTVEAVNKLVLDGVPFRDAYRRVAQEVENGTFTTNRDTQHSHTGSMGNLRNDLITDDFYRRIRTIVPDYV